MNRRRLMKSGGYSDPSQAAPLEVAFYNGSEIVIRKKSQWKNGEIPIGIVVVPGYHNRYGDGTCGIMSLVGMNCLNPKTGVIVSKSTQSDGATDGEEMYWGSTSSVGNSMFSSTTGRMYIPRQTANGTETSVYKNSDYVQWPYGGTPTSLTPAKSETPDVVVPSMSATSGNTVGDFNGIKNTAACYIKSRYSSQWTANTVNATSGYSPVAACAGRFKTVGTKSFYDVYSGIKSGNVSYGTSSDTYDYKGMWYLPGLGELCYLASKIYEINETILALNNKYGNVGVKLNFNNCYWSSSEYSATKAWFLGMNQGRTDGETKNDYTFYVRAFMRL